MIVLQQVLFAQNLPCLEPISIDISRLGLTPAVDKLGKRGDGDESATLEDARAGKHRDPGARGRTSTGARPGGSGETRGCGRWDTDQHGGAGRRPETGPAVSHSLDRCS